MAGIDALKPGKALGLGLLLAGVNPKNLMLAAAAGAGLAQLEISTGDAAGSLVVFVIIGSLTIAGPFVYYLLGGPAARALNVHPVDAAWTPNEPFAVNADNGKRG